MLPSPDGDVCITNDGATILEPMKVENQIGKLLVDVSKAPDDEGGAGRTGSGVQALSREVEGGKPPTRIISGGLWG